LPVLQYNFEESIGYWLTMAHQAYHREFSARVAPHGITYRQAQVLGWLVVEGRLTQAELATRMFVEPPTLVGVLDRMEHSGWISRQPCCEDRRKKWIVPQQAAESVWQKITKCARELREQATEDFSKSELVTLRRFLSRVQANMSRTTAAAKCD